MRGWTALVLSFWALACGRPSVVAAPAPRSATPVTAAPRSAWPDVGAPLPSEQAGALDAAVVVAIERYPELPPIPGARRNGADWARFLRESYGVRPENIAALYDAGATRAAVLDAVRRGAAESRGGGRLWFVF